MSTVATSERTEELVDRLKPDTTLMSREEFMLILQRSIKKRGLPARDLTARLRMYAQLRDWIPFSGKDDDAAEFFKRLGIK